MTNTLSLIHGGLPLLSSQSSASGAPFVSPILVSFVESGSGGVLQIDTDGTIQSKHDLLVPEANIVNNWPVIAIPGNRVAYPYGYGRTSTYGFQYVDLRSSYLDGSDVQTHHTWEDSTDDEHLMLTALAYHAGNSDVYFGIRDVKANEEGDSDWGYFDSSWTLSSLNTVTGRRHASMIVVDEDSDTIAVDFDREEGSGSGDGIVCFAPRSSTPAGAFGPGTGHALQGWCVYYNDGNPASSVQFAYYSAGLYNWGFNATTRARTGTQRTTLITDITDSTIHDQQNDNPFIGIGGTAYFMLTSNLPDASYREQLWGYGLTLTNANHNDDLEVDGSLLVDVGDAYPGLSSRSISRVSPSLITIP